MYNLVIHVIIPGTSLTGVIIVVKVLQPVLTMLILQVHYFLKYRADVASISRLWEQQDRKHSAPQLIVLLPFIPFNQLHV